MRRWASLAAVLGVLMSAATVRAQDADALRERLQTLQKFAQLGREAGQLLEAKKYEEAIAKCLEQAKVLPDQPTPYYNIACAHARLGQTEEAFKYLSTCVEKGFNDPAHMRVDPDLEGLHDDKRFDALVAKVRENEKKVGGAAYDKGVEIEGVKTVEDFPEGGLRYRLRMSPDATREKPNRLIVWLHPSGGSMNNVVEKLASRFIARNFALLVPTQKNWRAWTPADANRLVKRTLPAVAKIEGIDAEKPVLLGYSAGGQIAIGLWRAEPAKFGGLVLDAAYPIAITGPRRITILGPSKDEARKQVPVFVFVGENDRTGVIWKRVGPVWQKLGVPLRVDFVPDKGHAWLLGNFQLAALDGWLSDVAAGKIPESPPIEGAAPPDDNPTPDDDTKPEPPEFK